MRLPPEVLARIRPVAEEDGLTIAMFIRRCVLRELEVRDALRLEQERYEREGR